MRRSHAPIFWLLFGAGGMLAALLGPVMVWVSGLDGAFGLWLNPDTMSYSNVKAMGTHWLGQAFLFSTASLFAWHAMHRIFHTLHDLGVQAGLLAKLICYGIALAVTVVSGLSLLQM